MSACHRLVIYVLNFIQRYGDCMRFVFGKYTLHLRAMRDACHFLLERILMREKNDSTLQINNERAIISIFYEYNHEFYNANTSRDAINLLAY